METWEKRRTAVCGMSPGGEKGCFLNRVLLYYSPPSCFADGSAWCLSPLGVALGDPGTQGASEVDTLSVFPSGPASVGRPVVYS